MVKADHFVDEEEANWTKMRAEEGSVKKSKVGDSDKYGKKVIDHPVERPQDWRGGILEVRPSIPNVSPKMYPPVHPA